MEALGSPEDVYEDYMRRRFGILKALTSDVDAFYSACDPGKENLCLYGHPDSSWSVSLPAEEIPAELPEPTLGINFARDGMSKRDWLALVAVHSDCWLMAVATFNAARFDRKGRARMLELINDLPTVYEMVSGKLEREQQSRASKRTRVDDEEGNAEGEPCPITHRPYKAGEFWIACDKCDRWFYGKAVNMTPQKAEAMKTWVCPFCFKPH